MATWRVVAVTPTMTTTAPTMSRVEGSREVATAWPRWKGLVERWRGDEVERWRGRKVERR